MSSKESWRYPAESRIGGNMSGIHLLRKSQAVALGLALAAGARGYAIARVTPGLSAAGHGRASPKVAVPDGGPQKNGLATNRKKNFPNVGKNFLFNVVRRPDKSEG